ncbi:MAG: hypothetical protein FWC26_07315 [Fibromonadales bacterium]|nr:hypothetical protein [Fibromonadales bacterium]
MGVELRRRNIKKAINIVLAALMVFAIGACEEKKSQVGSTSTSNDADKSATEKIVKIGNQVWMSENLNDASKGGKCYENKPENCEKYGRLYTWEEAMKSCPSGWNLPNNAEWQTLVDFAGGDGIAAKKLKAKKGWNDYDGKSGNGADYFGFSALPGGIGSPFGKFFNVGNYGYWWSSSSESNSNNACFRGIHYDDYFALGGETDKTALFSVRCVKD